MSPTALIPPALLMFLLTAGVIVYMAVRRFRAVGRRQVSIKFYRTYDEGAEPPEIRVITRHVANHFELPPLFYIGILLTIAADAVTTTAVVAAWAFVAARYVHTAVHLGWNNVNVRFLVFGLGLIALLTLWGALAVVAL